MLRREAIAVIAAACARGAETLPGAAVLIDADTKRVLLTEGSETARRYIAPPGSTLKPFVLAALLRAGKLRADEPFPCSGTLTIAGRDMSCSHPRIATPMNVRTALAYSCNCFVAHFAARFAAGELANALLRYGLNARPETADAQRLQALGENGIALTAADLALAYQSLSQHAPDPVVLGLEAAVEFGTAQLARIPGIAVAGKTGSVLTPDGAGIAWFAGFEPSRKPNVVIAVMVQGHSGGADAAPVAARILRKWL